MCSTSLHNFYSFMMVFMIIAGVTYFILSFVMSTWTLWLQSPYYGMEGQDPYWNIATGPP